MMNIRKKIMLSLIIFGLFMICPNIYVFADTIYQAVNSAQGTWITQKEDEDDETTGNYTIYYYKMTVPKGVYVVIESSGTQSAKVYKKMGDDNVVTWVGGTKTKEDVWLPNGVYYLKGEIGGRFRYKFKTYKNESNYKLTKAKALKAGKEITIVQAPEEDYCRWYKITLKKKQKITYWADISDVSLYDSKYRRISKCINIGGNKYRTSKYLKKGVYYFCINASRYPEFGYDKERGEVVHLKWK